VKIGIAVDLTKETNSSWDTFPNRGPLMHYALGIALKISFGVLRSIELFSES
jgi:hypothetical protein